MRKTLDSILEQALQEALASLKGKAKDMVEEALDQVLRARVQALLEGEGASTLAPIPTLRARGKGKAQAQAILLEAAPVKEESVPAKAPRRRSKAKGQPTPTPSHPDLEDILEGVKVALQKYSGITTPKGKGYPDVLFRRVRKVLEHARENGHHDLALLARSALAHINVDPKGVAMSSWQYLAGKLGLPVPISQA